MVSDKYLDNLDIYEVTKQFCSSYVFRCQNRQIMRATPRENLTIWIDIETKLPLYGEEVTMVMGSKATRFFVFEILDEELLGPEKTTQYIEVDGETFNKFIKAVAEKNRG